jgi:hypothetical protein
MTIVDAAQMNLLRSLQLVRQIASCCCRWKRFPVCTIEHDRFINDLAKLVEYSAFIAAVASARNQSGRTTDVDLIFFRPLDDFDVTITLLDICDSSIARLTART